MIQMPTTAAPPPTTQELLAPVAERIRLARRDRHFTWRGLARRAGFRPATLRRVESGERGFTAAAVGRIARALGIDEEELYPGGRPDAFWARYSAEMRRRYTEQVAAFELPLVA